MIWQTRTLGGICDDGRGIIRTGPFGSQLHRKDYQDTGIPVVMPQDIVDDRISTAKIARVGEEDALRLAQHRLAPGDIVYGRRGDIGRHALITPSETGWLCGTGCLRVSLRDAEVDPAFLHYYLSNPAVIEWIYGHAVGATMPNLNTSILRSIPITYPTRALQRCISGILSSYDDLIENNTRRIAILEEMAQAIYREWFVNFRFPGHEQVEMVESELGSVPARWEVKPLSKVAQINARSIRKGGEPEEILYVDISSASTGSVREPTSMKYADAPNRARRIVQHGDVIWSTVRPNRKVHGLVLDPPRNLIVSTGFAVVSSEVLPFAYLYHILTAQEFTNYLALHAKGSAYPAVSASDFENAEVLVPDAAVMQTFHEMTAPLLELRENLRRKNGPLRCARDLLLPRLISGEVDMEAAGEEIAGAAA